MTFSLTVTDKDGVSFNILHAGKLWILLRICVIVSLMNINQ